ncbi:MAG: ABC transporter ATP-binding protein [Candidatus Eisenbacteria sp.]|nr:ABC transporter ATP-binding protein [Candidatus Eisenbacteria bacterium]
MTEPSTTNPTALAVEMRRVTKQFPGVLANDCINLQVAYGEIHAIIGENGAGKSTLMSVLSGLLKADEGEVLLKGHPVRGRPHLVSRRGLGMVYQHFMLVPNFTVAENVILGNEPGDRVHLDLRAAEEAVRRLGQDYGLNLDPAARIEDLSVGEQQRVEILKVLYRGSDVIVLDEPTQVLTLQEKNELFETLRCLVRDGRTIIFITHHLEEVMALSDRVTVLRRGRVVASLAIQDTDIATLAQLMVGREIGPGEKRTGDVTGDVVLEVSDLTAVSERGLQALDGVSFGVRGGEILGLAGVEGNGQRELVETLTGLRIPSGGEIRIGDQSTHGWSPRQFLEAGVAVIPENRRVRGVVEPFTIAENLVLGRHWKRPFSKGWVLDLGAMEAEAKSLISDFGIVPPDPEILVRTLSGGNQQRVVVARELAKKPVVLIAAHPTRGLDIAGRQFAHSCLLRERSLGAAILLVSSDLEEILDLGDRIAVIFEGRITGILPREEASEGKLGLLMVGARR